MRMGIKRCPLNRLPDVEWSVTDFQQSVVHPTYDVRGAQLQLKPCAGLTSSILPAPVSSICVFECYQLSCKCTYA